MQITFSLPFVFYPGSSPLDNARVIKVALEALISFDQAYLLTHPSPGLYQGGIRYGRTESWDTIPEMRAKGFGDCKSLAAALIAEYRLKGIAARPVFRFAPPPNEHNYHILVETDSGFEDPSKALGMGQDESQWFRR
jgi:Transglutaminase-like superfamily